MASETKHICTGCGGELQLDAVFTPGGPYCMGCWLTRNVESSEPSGLARLRALNRELVEALERMDRTLWTGYADPVREFKKAVSAALAKARKEG